MKRVTISLMVLLSIIPIFWMVANAASPGPDTPTKETPPPSEKTEEIISIETAIYEKIEEDHENTFFFWGQAISIEKTGISNDGQWAASIMVPVNPRTGDSPETEPALAITVQVDGEWKPLFPNDIGWLKAVENAPDDLLSPEHKEALLQMNINAAVNMPTTAISGFLLPWEAGTAYYLTGSTCHDEYIQSGNGHYAFDFAYNRTMWDILAAKSAEVWVWEDDIPTCYEPSCWRDQPVGNYIVLRDTSTNPITYQLYLHLKQDSIPDEIKIRGYQIAQGQFIGIVDNTGQSSGSHLHFQVQVPYLGEDHYWGRSVDITFDDVDINNGRPRIHNPSYCMDFNFCTKSGDVCKTSQLYYTSQNERVYPEDSTPPIGDILSPITGETYGASIPIEGWAEDLGDGDDQPSGLHSVQFIAFYNGGWQDIGPKFDNLYFSYQWDWCAADVPDGPVSLAMRITDNRGNQTSGLPGLQHITKQYDCPPQPPNPTCQPTANKMAIFNNLDFQGNCHIFGKGSFPDSSYFGQVGDNATYSILVGDNVQAELFTEFNFTGRSEMLRLSDSNMSDNLTASGTISSIKVSSRTSSASTLPSTKTAVSKNTISRLNTAFNAPYFTNLEGGTEGWTVQNGSYWHLSSIESHSSSHSFRYADGNSNNFDNGTANQGYLESPLITLPASIDPYVLQFWYRYQTESHYQHWDQRWVQISIDSGDFINVYQLINDPMLGWFQARIDLLPFYTDMNLEHTVQVRYFFNSKDKFNNEFEGWFIDDFQIQAEPVTAIACPEDLYEPNDIPDPEHAKELTYGDTAIAVICPGWDFDYFRFVGTAGDRVIVNIDAKSNGSDLDGYLYLLDTDGRSELAESDDEILYVKQDPLLGYILPRDGEYYLKIQAWDHPMGKGEYTLDLSTDHQNPSIHLENPIEDSSIPIGKVTLKAHATDEESGVRFVRFLVHDSNWETGKWLVIGEDFDGSDGWSAVLDTASMSDGATLSVYAAAYDWGGNWDHDAAWKVRVNAQTISLNLGGLPNPSLTTGLHLHWSVKGGGSETAVVNVQRKINNGAWSDWLTNTNLTEYWYIGEASNRYAFQVSVQDYAGNKIIQQTNTSIPTASTLCSQPDSWDISATENDNGFSTATPISLNESLQLHNFCNPTSTDYLNDEDWLRFTAKEGHLFALLIEPQNGRSAAVTAQIYAANGTTLLAERTPASFGKDTHLYWVASLSGPVYVQLSHKNGNVAGNSVSYSVLLTDGSIYLPLVKK